MTKPRVYTINDVPYETDYRDYDDVRPPIPRFSRVELRSNYQEDQYPEIRNNEKKQTFESKKRSNFCSKQCLIGLAIGLAIGIVMVLVTAIPLGVVYRCSFGTISSTPNWIGTYQMDNGCDTSTCCCFSNKITVTRPSSNQIQVSGSVTGACSSFYSPVILTQSWPSGFQVFLLWSGETVRLQLGPDSSYLSFVNIVHGTCSSTALRTSTNAGSMKSMHLGLVIFILLITIGIMKS